MLFYSQITNGVDYWMLAYSTYTQYLVFIAIPNITDFIPEPCQRTSTMFKIGCFADKLCVRNSVQDCTCLHGTQAQFSLFTVPLCNINLYSKDRSRWCLLASCHYKCDPWLSYDLVAQPSAYRWCEQRYWKGETAPVECVFSFEWPVSAHIEEHSLFWSYFIALRQLEHFMLQWLLC